MKTYQRLFVLFSLICILYPLSGKAQTAYEIYKKFSKSYHTYQSGRLPFYFFVPPYYDIGKKYPLVLCLHGSGERGDDSTAVMNNSMATVWARDSNQSRWPCFILVPQCPISGWWVNGYSISPDLSAALDVMDSLTSGYSIDTNRIYLTGLSMGGYGTWALIIGYPGKFAAAVPMSGAGDTSEAGEIKKIPIWDFHGALDGTVPVSGSRDMMHALENAGAEVVYTDCHDGDCTGLPDSVVEEKIKSGAKILYTEYQTGTHTIWDVAYNEPLLLPWVFSQSKEDRLEIVRKPAPVAGELTLSQNYPNPFNPTTAIKYHSAMIGNVTLKVYDLLGREVGTLIDERQPAGDHTVILDASRLSSGVYFVVLLENGKFFSRKISLVK